MGRPSSPGAAGGIREILIAKLAGHVRETYDPRLVLGLEAGETPEPDPDYVDRFADMYDDLVAGRAVTCFPAWMVPRELGLVPYGVHQIDIAVDGTISETPRDG
jgi:hypothetical protein